MTALPKPSRRARLKAERAEEQDERLRRAEVRHAAVTRSGGLFCEWCRCRRVAEVHHVAYGVGKRREQETAETLAVVCVECHTGAHRGGEEALTLGFAWAKRHGFTVALREIERRLSKKRPA